MKTFVQDNIFFVSDTHFHHDKPFIYKPRGYTSSESHTKAVLDSINQTVKRDDILFHLGDFCLNTTLPQFNTLLDAIECQNIYLLNGNHNNPHEKAVYQPLVQEIMKHKMKRFEIYPIKHKNITYVGPYLELSVNGQFIVLFHYPLLSWNHASKGSWALVGHEHGQVAAIRPEAKAGKILDLGWDLFKKPVSFSEIKAIMDTKSVCSVGHHIVGE